ncbi:SIMPL domain-containing protein [Novosphingobium sp. CECT 9465]|uniref:SIMPL domain-containing protein n=1 Tax=Novosphingobium sp. CECT 9465 TaxID=2829794 RepID=UPI001E642B3E|nr:SIMPL domain-containing protein [Novosphingobium sp. CECT 9465]CAH0497373.1 26 kDa periplasmic immunogenic protein [Novosphingobium sp. CECT 9465]
MKRTFLLAAAMAALTPLAAAHAQGMSAGPVVASGNTLLSVAAEGKSTRTPDLAVFSAGVTTQAKTAGEALTENAGRMTAVIASLRKAGIAERDIQTSNLSVNPVYGQPKRMPDGSMEQQDPVIIGYQATNQVSVRQRKLDSYGKVIDTLVANGANQVNGPSFQIDNSDAAMDEARIEAMKKARARADLYAKAAGLRVVRVLTISENAGWSPPQPQVMFARAEMAGAPKSSPVAAGELEMTVTINVTYELAS